METKFRLWGRNLGFGSPSSTSERDGHSNGVDNSVVPYGIRWLRYGPRHRLEPPAAYPPWPFRSPQFRVDFPQDAQPDNEPSLAEPPPRKQNEKQTN